MPETAPAEKMQVIVDSLIENPDLILVAGIPSGIDNESAFPFPVPEIARTMDLFVFPTMPTHSSNALNIKLDAMLPETIVPDESIPFSGGATYELSKKPTTQNLVNGRLEVIGENYGYLSLAATTRLRQGFDHLDPSSKSPNWQTSIALTERTIVRLFPNAVHTMRAIHGENVDTIPRADLLLSLIGRLSRSILLGSTVLGRDLYDQAMSPNPFEKEQKNK